MPSLIEYPSPAACLMHLVRHGATPHNEMKPPRLQGAGVDSSLSDVGRRQAARTAEHFAPRPIRAVYSSPMRRAMETAELIARNHDQIVEPVAGLREADIGRWEGRTWAEVQRDDARAYARHRENPYEHGYPDGESLNALLDRVTPEFERLMRAHVGEEIVVVAHSVVNRLYLGELLGVAPNMSHITPTSNCGISTVRCKNGVAKVLTLNATSHLMNGRG